MDFLKIERFITIFFDLTDCWLVFGSPTCPTESSAAASAYFLKGNKAVSDRSNANSVRIAKNTTQVTTTV